MKQTNQLSAHYWLHVEISCFNCSKFLANQVVEHKCKGVERRALATGTMLAGTNRSVRDLGYR